MNKKILILAFLIIFSNLVFADKFTGIDDGAIISFDENIMKVNVIGTSVKVTKNQEYRIINLQSCEIFDDLKICLENSDYDIHTDSTKADINITIYDADLVITRKLEDSNLYIGIKNKILVTIKNQGTYKTTNTIYEESLPSNFKLIDCKNCKIQDNKIIFSKDISKNDEESFEYEIVAIGDEPFTSSAKITYTTTTENEIFTDGLTLTPKQPFELKLIYEDDSLTIGEETKLNVTLVNKVDSKIVFDKVIIYVPLNAEIGYYKKGNFESGKIENLGSFKLYEETIYKEINYTVNETIDGNITEVNYTDYELEESKTKEFLFHITPRTEDPINLIFDFYYEINGENVNYLGYKNVIDPKDLDTSSKISFNSGDKFDETSKEPLMLYLTNPYENSKLIDVKLKIESPLIVGIEELNYGEIEKGMSKRIFYKTVKFPKINSTIVKSYIIYNITFNDEFRNSYEINKKIDFSIIPISPLKIVATGCTKTLKFGEVCEYEIKATNNLKGDISGVFIREILESNKPLIESGVLYTKISIDSETTKTAYKYKIMYPKNLKDYVKEFNITTIANYEYLGENYEETLVRKVVFDDFQDKADNIDISLTATFDASKFYQGVIYILTQTVENKYDKPIKNAIISFDELKNVDFIDSNYRVIENLNPKEKVNLNFYFRSKLGGKQNISSKLIFEDEDGYLYEKDFKNQTIDFIENSYTGPSIFVDIYSKKNVTPGELVPIKIILTNNGNDDALVNLELFDGSIRTTNLASKGSYSLSQDIVIGAYGNILVHPINANYTYANRNYFVNSNSLTISSKKEEKNVQESSTQVEKIKQSEDIKEIGDSKNINIDEEIIDEVKEDNKSSFLQKILIKIKSWFGLN